MVKSVSSYLLPDQLQLVVTARVRDSFARSIGAFRVLTWHRVEIEFSGAQNSFWISACGSFAPFSSRQLVCKEFKVIVDLGSDVSFSIHSKFIILFNYKTTL